MPVLGAIRGTQTNYPYAVARVQARRARLIPPSEYQKVLKMDVAEITRFIQESDYRREVDELASRFRGLDLLEAALTVNEERTFQDVRRLVSGDGARLIDLWLERHLFENLKTVLRGKAAGASREELLKDMLLEDLGAYSLFAPMLADDVRTVDDAIAALDRQGGRGHELARVLQKLPPGSPLPRLEEALDRYHYAQLVSTLEASKLHGADKVLEVVRREIDALNLLNAARWVVAGVGGDFTPYIVPGGRHLRVGDIVALSRAKDLAQFQETLGDNAWGPKLADGLAEARAAGRLAPLHADVRRELVADLDKLGHSNPLSIIPILLFLIRKHREVVVLRAIARGKAAGLSEARLAELAVVS
ncbi:MAG TPA: V-type ATPase subunit [Candidatus Thermoplasmatota archaeon]|nr:V-type ATPase subunit [Candidatus Thermoplasmatota archaeon]